MIFYRITGALALLVCGILWASHLNGKLRDKRRQTAAIEEWLRFMRGQIDCFSMPILDILALSGDRLAECGYLSDVIPRDFSAFLEGSEIYDGEIREALSELGASFGGCYREEQLKACDRCIERVSSRLRCISEEMPKKKKLNSTLCVSAALAIAILLV